ncbi:hypothetical protein CCR82_06195 [Halochromatium salexigens]|uniref:Uncharacterized protein n=2 Tax=Halochromatium salexigens TaxID=49447 RepID=A0AAJ0UFV4_HALSE|nr:hypothetical protein [Halochromatium salexigens]
MSCSAHALLEADRYPEALRIFDDWQALESFEQAERTLHGLAWRRRSQYARLVAKHEFERVVGRVPTHGELANAIFVWKQRLQDYSPGMREVFRQQCNPLFEEANRWAEEHRGPLPERLDMP